MPVSSVNTISVHQLTTYIKNIFASDYLLNSVKVTGEISNIKYHSSGHIYFTLKDADAQINCVMFNSNARTLKFRPADGDRCIVSGSISIYEKTGAYQLYAKKIEKDGTGNLYEQFEQLKQKLLSEGLFDAAHKKKIPEYVKTVGIVTAGTGAAIRDIVNISRRRNPYVQLILYPALVQGEHAAQSISEGIRCLDAIGVDVIIVGRGGGSIEDLWAFNEEIVARAIYECETPIVSAVGHETDTTISDYVSDLRAPTPSAAAELCVFEVFAVLDVVADYKDRLFEAVMNNISYKQDIRLKHLSDALRLHNPEYYLNNKRQELASLCDKLLFALKAKTNAKNNELELARNRLNRLIEIKNESCRHRLENMALRLENRSPLKRLGGGYGYITTNGHAVLDTSDLNTGDVISIYLRDGLVRASVDEITDHNRLFDTEK